MSDVGEGMGGISDHRLGKTDITAFLSFDFLRGHKGILYFLKQMPHFSRGGPDNHDIDHPSLKISKIVWDHADLFFGGIQKFSELSFKCMKIFSVDFKQLCRKK